MKTLLSLLLVAVCAGSLYGQTGRGTVLLGAGINYHSTSGNTETTVGNTTVTTQMPKTITMGVNATVGYFVIDNLSINASLGFSNSVNKYTQSIGPNDFDVTQRNPEFNFSLSGSYYIGIADRMYFVPSVFVGGSAGKVETESRNIATNVTTTTTDNTSGATAGLTAGLLYFPADHIGLNFNVGLFSVTMDKRKGGNTTETTNHVDFFLSSFNPTLAFYYFFY